MCSIQMQSPREQRRSRAGWSLPQPPKGSKHSSSQLSWAKLGRRAEGKQRDNKTDILEQQRGTLSGAPWAVACLPYPQGVRGSQVCIAAWSLGKVLSLSLGPLYFLLSLHILSAPHVYLIWRTPLKCQGGFQDNCFVILNQLQSQTLLLWNYSLDRTIKT